jgi:hypothetical protein
VNSDVFYAVLVLVTFLVAIRAMVALYRVERLYRARLGESQVLDRQRRWAWIIGLSSIPVAVLAGWALMRYAFPELNLGGLPSPLTTVVVIIAVNLGMLWLVNLERTWRSLVRDR